MRPPPRDEERYRRLGDELDDVKRRAVARVGASDLAYVRRMNRFSRGMEIAGRLLIMLSPEPVTFLLGVGALWVHKQLQSTEIGHTALHGAYDRIPGAGAFASKRFRWDTPIDEESWRMAHNVRHHGNTNVAGKDPDIDFGPVRLTTQTPHNALHKWQLPLALAGIFPFFAFTINLHVTGLTEAIAPDDKPLHFLADRSKESRRAALKKALRKFVPYYLYNFVLFPLLAGPFFFKVLLGNVLAEALRDVYSACTIFCGHVGHDVESFPAGARAHGRGEWYAMQIAATNNFEVSRPVSVLCGGLDRQIEHHLFPQLPPQRLREIAPEVRAICERHGLEYKTASWGRTLGKALGHIRDLAAKGRSGSPLSEIVREMS
ncbi:MAG TPA: acyl-CoA desaturase [Polyangiaceae bacterium]|nr:acyl-CoA desaturase [Polyangiaceae bacterium]